MPVFDSRAARYTLTAAAVLLLLGVIYLIRETLLVFVIALLFAYLLYPLVDVIDRRLSARSRTLALLITYVLVIGILVVFGTLIGSVVADQAGRLAQAAPGFVERIRDQPAPGPQEVRSIRDQIVGAIEGQIRQHYGEIVSVIPRLSLRVLSASKNLIYVVLVPILSFFILKDGRRIRDTFIEMFDRGRDSIFDVLMDIHTLLLQYMRALLFLCLATFVTFSLVLSAMGVPYSILLASVAFPLEFIPVVGPLAAAVVIVAVSAFSGFPHVLWVIIFLGAYRLFQDYVLSPHLMSSGVELHPLLVIFGVFAGGEIGGVAGTFLSVPILALIRLFYHRLRKRRLSPRVPVLAK